MIWFYLLQGVFVSCGGKDSLLINFSVSLCFITVIYTMNDQYGNEYQEVAK